MNTRNPCRRNTPPQSKSALELTGLLRILLSIASSNAGRLDSGGVKIGWGEVSWPTGFLAHPLLPLVNNLTSGYFFIVMIDQVYQMFNIY
jgi:hypothetical protein